MLLGSDSDPRPRVKVLDFGIAKMSQESEGSLRTETGAMIGTPGFLTTLRMKAPTVQVNVVKVAVGYARMST